MSRSHMFPITTTVGGVLLYLTDGNMEKHVFLDKPPRAYMQLVTCPLE